MIKPAKYYCKIINKYFFTNGYTFSNKSFCKCQFITSLTDTLDVNEWGITVNIDELKGFKNLNEKDLVTTTNHLYEIFSKLLPDNFSWSFLFKTKYFVKPLESNKQDVFEYLVIYKSHYIKNNDVYVSHNNVIQKILDWSNRKVSGIFAGINFPIIKRVASTLLSNNIVSVQPMSLPTRKLFYLNPVGTP